MKMAHKKSKYPRLPGASVGSPEIVNAVTTFDMWYSYLTLVAITAYTWEGLPDTVDARYMELYNFYEGKTLFFQDRFTEDFYCLPFNFTGRPNIYNVPNKRVAQGANGQRFYCDTLNSVVIWNNSLRTSTAAIANEYAYRIANLDIASDVNIGAQRTPVAIATSENNRLTLKNIYEQYAGGMPVIITSKGLDLSGFNVLKTDAPLVAPSLNVLKHQYINEYMTMCGIENSNEDKKERLVANEVGSNYGAVERSRKIGLTSREKAAEQINKMFGLNVSVRFNSDLSTMLNMPNIGGDASGKIYDRSPVNHPGDDDTQGRATQ